MKKICVIFLALAVLCGLSACDKTEYSDVTPTLNAIEQVFIQRTVIDENGKYSYKEKVIEGEADIKAFCKKIDGIKFVGIDPVEFSEVDYLVVFEGPLKHKLYFRKDEIIYDGLAYKSVKGSLKESVSKIYDALPQKETDASSKLFS